MLGDALPRAESTLANLSLFKLIVVMCALVLFSVGEAILRGQRVCWPVSWVGFGVLAFGFGTLALILELAVAAAAALDCLWTAMLGRLSTARSAVWLRHVAPIVGTRGCPAAGSW